jgi:chromate transporter
MRVAARMGLGAFGSSQRVLGQLEQGLVHKERWLSPGEYGAVGPVVDLLPGAPSANTLALLGQRFGGWTWSLGGYLAFVLPGVVLTLVAAVLYVQLDLGTRAEPVFRGFGAASVGVILALTLRRVRGAITQRWQMLIAGASLLLTVAGKASPTEVVLLGAAGGLAVELGMRRRRPISAAAPDPPSGPAKGSNTLRCAVLAAVGASAAVAHASGLDVQVVEALVLYFRTGLGAYGGGLAVIPHLSERLDALEWLSRRHFADAVSVALLTPGPVLRVATFAGYLHHGAAGAAAATLALFSAPWVVGRLAGGWLERVRNHPVATAAASGLHPAVVGLMASAALIQGSNFHGPAGLGIAAAAALTLVRWDFNPAIVVAVGGVLRLGLHLVGV